MLDTKSRDGCQPIKSLAGFRPHEDAVRRCDQLRQVYLAAIRVRMEPIQ